MADELVHYDVVGGTATITLDSPHNRNALSAQLRRELSAALESAREDDAVRVVLLTHTGPVFCAGMDLKEARGAGAGAQGVNEFPKILDQLWTSPKPVVARLAGPARAGGIGMVAACDIAVAVPEATFAFSEVRIGVVPAIISLTVLPRLNPRAAHELFLTGEVFDARRAVEIGLLNAAVPAGELDAKADSYLKSLTLGGPRALAATKALLSRPRPATPSEGFAAMNELSTGFFAGEEGQEGILAFAQKRKPNWVPAED
ncbi:enoyl-CoA hydratase-related protein [Amycolatopsis sp. PS_44_ISF1]|uniref:enoyl-CoA hydratase-related protein n=1 Tax=Amycolatopsis sp. PS_44_ISF1 TaxID=2974917 RepID=UPI0028DE8AB9|nr:enoyl-CoA hydratase-related protein [Amycolatopsis sp. PS_44_ISF1]MDT8914592.1 enoyl-CoA hydratase-related protein [Amycolatopsis sp. PS_44_ISF1]